MKGPGPRVPASASGLVISDCAAQVYALLSAELGRLGHETAFGRPLPYSLVQNPALSNRTIHTSPVLVILDKHIHEEAWCVNMVRWR